MTDETSNLDYIQIAWYGVDIANSINEMTKADTIRKERIMRKSLLIAEKIINETHAELMDDTKDD